MSKTAKEMFEELGYKKYENHPEQEIKEPSFTTQDLPYIEYICENDEALISIKFDLWGKNIWYKGYRKDVRMPFPCPINCNEYKAINKQVEELGWNNE